MSDQMPPIFLSEEFAELFAVIERAHRGSWSDLTEYERAPRAIADALVAAGYRKVEVTDEMVKRAAVVLAHEFGYPEVGKQPVTGLWMGLARKIVAAALRGAE